MILLACGSLLIFLLLGALQWFNTSGVDFLTPETYGQTLVFTALEGLLFLLLLLLLVLLFRNLFRVYVGEGSNALGARLRSRLVLGAVMIALMPAALMYLFSYVLMNRSLERWFSPSVAQLRDDTSRVVRGMAQYVTENARVEAEAIAASGAADRDLPQLDAELRSHRITLAGGFAVVYDQNRNVLASFQAPPASSLASAQYWVEDGDRQPPSGQRWPLSDILLTAAQHADERSLNVAGQRFALGMSATASGKVAVVALPMPEGLSKSAANINSSTAEYWQLFHSRTRIRTIFFLFLLLLTVFDFFFSVWLALFLSKQITRPVEALADAMNEIAKGGYERRVTALATGEMADLVRSFNHMAADLEASRHLAESAQAQLTAANLAIEERRRELETIVETIPSGVVTLDSSGTVLQANRGFAALMGLKDNTSLVGGHVENLLPADCAADLAETIRRGNRMGAASTEIEFFARGKTIHLAVTSARLELSRGQAGSVLVVEDTTDLLRAQRQMAWKEVAQQVAHEIKNPLTPIALSAERIGKYLDRAQPESPNVIRKCSEVILSCVSTLRRLVDQFSALAQFPAPQPRLCGMNQIVEEALAQFGGRLEGITVQRNLAEDLPQVMVDHESLRRALANLIDNAADAMQGSLLRLLGVRTALSEDGVAVEITVSDTGTGLTDEIRERLFLPFYSTKHRGTGLGLSIAAKIAQEHGGSISAEPNSPKGARFVLRLPLIEPAIATPAEEAAKGIAS